MFIVITLLIMGSSLITQQPPESEANLPKKESHEKYGSTLPASKEQVNLVRVYCMLHQIPVYQFVGRLLDRELEKFKYKLETIKKIKVGGE